MEHRSAFVATEGELLAGNAQAQVWQQCGTGNNSFLPEAVNPDVALDEIMGWPGRRAKHGTDDHPTLDPDELYPSRLRAMMPEPSKQVKSSLAVWLTRPDKEPLDLLAAWLLCTTDQLAGLMGGLTRRRANQVLRSLTDLALIRADGDLHVLTDEGLTYLARRDRAAAGQVLDRRTQPQQPAGLRRHCLAQRSVPARPPRRPTHLGRHSHRRRRPQPGLRLLDLLPTSCSAVGYWHDDTNYVVHPDISFILELPRGIPSLLPGIRAPRHHAPAGAGKTGELPPLLPERLRPSGSRRGAVPWCCSSSRLPTTRTPSWTPPATSITPPSPTPTWRPSPNTASWLTRGCCPPLRPGKGCNCSDWSRYKFVSKAVPGVSCWEVTNKRE